MRSRNHVDLRYVKPWARSQLRRSRGLLAITIILVTGALFFAFRHLRRAGFFSRIFGLGDPLWSYSYLDASATSFPPHDPTYVVFEPPASFHTPSQTLERVRELPSECIDAFFAAGRLCHTGPDPPLDVVWTWVNGSDRLLQESMVKTVQSTGFKFPATSRSNSQFFRDHDELRHSIRSVLKHFAAHTAQLHIVTSDFPIRIPVMDGGRTYNRTRRLGLAPRWLDPESVDKWQDGHVHLGLKHHAEIFRTYNGSSFNSYGIESQLMNIQGVSENFIYMNDDFFMMANLSASDFYTSAYGTVLRMQADLLVNNNNNPHAPAGGEWGPLEYTNWLLSNRFGLRRRPYTTHAAKSLSMSLMKELSRIWHAELVVTASHPFRGMKNEHRDVYSMFLFSHFLVERWREGLLWSWVVGKLGGLDGQWGPAEKENAWRDLGGLPGERELRVVTTKRTALDVVHENFQSAGYLASGKTTYAFVSGDGFPYDYRSPGGALAWPSFGSPGDFVCKIDYQACFEQQPDATAADFFKYIAFDNNRKCGDCILHALRAASGPTGLAAVLPDASRNYTAKYSRNRRQSEDAKFANEPPHLPLTSDWRDGDFSLSGVITSQGQVNIRTWTLRMLERYRFVIGQTPTAFHQISSATAARIKLKKVDEDKDVALLCLNDNIQGMFRQANGLLLTWQERRWGHKAEWER